MAQDTLDDEFSQLWERHLTMLRDDFSATSVQALPSLPSISRSFDGGDEPEQDSVHPWDDKIDSVVDALDELILQSPMTADTHSPGTPWFPDRDGYTDTALSSPLNSSWPRTIRSSRIPGLPHLRVDDGLDPANIGLKGKEVERRYTHSPDSTVPFLLQKQLLLENHLNRSNPGNPLTATTATAVHSPFPSTPSEKPPPTQVHALILTWAKSTITTPTVAAPSPRRVSYQTQLPSPTLFDTDPETETTETLRTCLKRRGYRVQCRTIPADYPTAAVETVLDRFLDKSNAESLLVVYYRGFGFVDGEGRMVFVSDATPNASSFFWDDVRDPIMQVPGDVLLVFDCTAPPGTAPEQWEMRVGAGMVSSASTKQLLGVCVPPDGYRYDRSTTVAPVPGDGMTQSLCRTLDRMGDAPVLSVQRLCSLMREDLRGTGLASRVFVSQLGGGQLLDIHLPLIAALPRAMNHDTS